MKNENYAVFINTPGIEECANYMIIQRLIEHRIRSVLTDSAFSDITRQLVIQFMTPPDKADTPELVEEFVALEAASLLNTFNLYEKLASYQDNIQALKHYVGKQFSITSITFTGIQVIINA